MKVRIETLDRMSNRGFHRCGGHSSGAARWWIRGDGGFADLSHVYVGDLRGDRYLQIELDLEPGDYVVGTGRGRDSIRLRFRIADDGSIDVRSRDLVVEPLDLDADDASA